MGGLAKPEPRSIHGDRPYALETFEQGNERERGRAAAVQQLDRRSLARLDDMHSSTGAKLDLSTACR
jgi:hypothetical protein